MEKYVALMLPYKRIELGIGYSVYKKQIYKNGDVDYTIIENCSGAFDNESEFESYITIRNGVYSKMVLREFALK